MTCTDTELKRNGVSFPYLIPFPFTENAFMNQLLLYREIIRFPYDTDMAQINSLYKKCRVLLPILVVHVLLSVVNYIGVPTCFIWKAKFSKLCVIYCNMLSSFHI